ncbi:MAG: porin [Burkholderiaceae bacterium]
MTRFARWATLAAVAAAPIASFAQTNVSMYGVADAGVVYADPRAPGYGGALRVDTSIMSTSRWGIRGTEDLGGGLSAYFNAEANWGLDDGTGDPAAGNGLTFARRSIVGLQGRFGQIFLGREYTPAFYAGYANDLFAYGMNGTTLVWNVQGVLPIRYSNAIFYNTPNWGGVQIRFAYGKAAFTGTEYYTSSRKRDNNGDVAVLYNRGAIQANAYYRFGYQNVAETDAARFSPPKVRQYGAGFGYKFGIVRMVTSVAISDPDNLGTANDKVLAWNLGVGVRAGPGEVLVQGHQVRYKNELTGEKPRADTLGIAYTYPLSKRTTLYASWAMTRNKHGANQQVRNNTVAYGGSSLGGTAGVDTSPRVLALGIQHLF